MLYHAHNGSVRVGNAEMAMQGNYKELMIDTAEKSYSERYLKNTEDSILYLEDWESPKVLSVFSYRQLLVFATMLMRN